MILGSDKKGRVVEKHRAQLMPGGIFGTGNYLLRDSANSETPSSIVYSRKATKPKKKLIFQMPFVVFFKKLN